MDPSVPPEIDAYAAEMADQVYFEWLDLRNGATTSPPAAFPALVELDLPVMAEVYAAMAEPSIATARGNLTRARFRPMAANRHVAGADLFATVLAYSFVRDLDGVQAALAQSSEKDRLGAAHELCRFRSAGPIRWA